MNRIRRADPAEAPLLSALAMRSKQHWGYDDAFMAEARADLEVRPQNLPGFHIYVLEADGRAIGFYSLVPGGDGEVELNALFVEPEFIGQGHGRALWAHAIDLARGFGFTALFLTAEPNTEAFYIHCGAVRAGERESPIRRGRMLPLLRYRLA